MPNNLADRQEGFETLPNVWCRYQLARAAYGDRDVYIWKAQLGQMRSLFKQEGKLRMPDAPVKRYPARDTGNVTDDRRRLESQPLMHVLSSAQGNRLQFHRIRRAVQSIESATLPSSQY